MRITRAEAEQNRRRALTAASRLVREQGFEGMSVGEVMKAAGLTHGGFYNHFASKAALGAEALAEAWAVMALERAKAPDLAALVTAYLSPAARAHPGKACPAAALAAEVHRQPAPVREAFADGLEAMIASIEMRLDEAAGDAAGRRARAVSLATRMIGALMLARAVPDDQPLAAELLETNLSAALAELGRPTGDAAAPTDNPSI